MPAWVQIRVKAVHPIRNLIDLKRRLDVGRHCFGYFHPAIPGEPLIFIEVALLKDKATSIQEVLWDDPPTPEYEARCALFYSISSTQTGLSGINLGKFLLKRVVDMLKRDMPSVQVGSTVLLMTAKYPNKEIVAYATIISTNPKANVGGVETGKQFYKVCINHPVEKDEPLVRPMPTYNNIGDAHAKGVPIAWLSIFVQMING